MDTYQKKNTSRDIDLLTPLETEAYFSDYFQDISKNGLLCYSKKYFDEMTLLDMRFQLPCFLDRKKNDFYDGWIECKGVVINCERITQKVDDNHYEVAVYFSEISDKYKKILVDFIRTNPNNHA